jgi:hypothetical protein
VGSDPRGAVVDRRAREGAGDGVKMSCYAYMSRDEAIAAGIPVAPDAVGVRIYGATVGEPSRPADADEIAREIWEFTDEPIHLWFGLSYASFFVMPRTVMQSMPAGFAGTRSETTSGGAGG